MSGSFPLEELRALLNKARAVDKYCNQFGADEHKYQWNPPASVEEVEDFEQKIGVRLPEEYRNFCYWLAMAVQDLIMACFLCRRFCIG